MLPLVLVLVAATSVLAAPYVELNQYEFDEVPRPRNNGKIVSSYVTTVPFELIDGGDTTPYVLSVEQIINDLANLSDKKSQAIALGQTVGVLSQLATGIPGDACAAANVIEAFVESGRSGNSAGLRKAVRNFVNNLISNVDVIVGLAQNPDAARFAVGTRGKCSSGGRIYPLEAAWSAVTVSASGPQSKYLEELRCYAKRMYGSLNVQTNNVGAYITAASLPPVVQVVQYAREPLAKFLESVATGNPASYAGSLQKALSRGLSSAGY